MPIHSYDLIVLGDELAGLVAATLCARRGMRVLLATSRAAAETYQVGPFELPVRPLAFVGGGSPAVRRVVDELHFSHLLKRKLTDNAPPLQLVAPEARLDLMADDEALARELARELPELAAGLAEVFRRVGGAAAVLDPVLAQEIALPPSGFWERREIARAAGRLPGEAELLGSLADVPLARALLFAPAALGAGTDPQAVAPVAAARALHLWRHGAARLAGGRAALRAIFLDKFASHSGELRVAAPAEIAISWGKATGVRLKDRAEDLGAEHVIAAMPVAELLPLCGKKPPRRLQQAEAAARPAAYRYTLNLIMAEAGVPAGLGPAALVIGDPERPLIGDNVLAIHVGAVDDEARVLVTIEALCEPPSEGERLEDKLADLRIRVRERLEQVMPFSSEHVLLAHSPNEAAAPEGIEDAELEPPRAPPPVWSAFDDAALGVGGLPYDIGIKRLTLASSQLLPGLGLEGDFAAGYSAARLACDATGRKRDYLRNEVIAGTDQPA